jgi:hypothetical protein
MLRGELWADGVYLRGRRGTWPTFEASPRARAIALRKVADLASDPRVAEALAEICNEVAEKRYCELVTDPEAARRVRNQKRVR